MALKLQQTLLSQVCNYLESCLTAVPKWITYNIGQKLDCT